MDKIRLIDDYVKDGQGGMRDLTKKEKDYIIQWAKDIAHASRNIPFGPVAYQFWVVTKFGDIVWRENTP